MRGLPYRYRRFSLVEVPGSFTAFSRAWTSTWEWSQPAMANRLVSVYHQSDGAGRTGSRDGVTGMTAEERASLLLQTHSLQEMIADTTKNGIIGDIIKLKAEQLFAYGEMELGRDSFAGFFSQIVESYPFQNLSFEQLIAQLKDSTGVQLTDRIADWYQEKGTVRYLLAKTEHYRVQQGIEFKYEVSQIITNDSDKEGMIIIMLQFDNDDYDSHPVIIQSHQTIQAVFLSDEGPRNLIVRTLISNNLPGRVQNSLSDWSEHTVRRSFREAGINKIERPLSFVPEGEILVDNEDENLFSTTTYQVYGLLFQWLLKPQDAKYKYRNFSAWQPPIQWTPTVNNNYYGQFVRSAMVIRSGGNGGDKNQTATRKIPVTTPGQYAVYYNIWENDNAFPPGNRLGTYDFHITKPANAVDVEASLEYRRCEPDGTI